MLRAGDRTAFSVRLGRIWQLGLQGSKSESLELPAFEGDFAGGQRTKLLSATKPRRAGPGAAPGIGGGMMLTGACNEDRVAIRGPVMS
jgi:hypothetical protein